MAIQTLTDAAIVFGQYSLSADHNKLELAKGFEEQDDTRFGHTAKSLTGTIPFARCVGEGFVTLGSDQVLDIVQKNLNVADLILSVAPQGLTEGNYVESFLARLLQLEWGGPVGRLNPFKLTAHAQGQPSINGTIVGTGTKGATGNGSAYQLGTLDSGYRMYAGLHVLSASGGGDTLDVVIASDNAEGFPSGTTRLTFTQATAVGNEWLSLAGPIATDDWWRAEWTLAGGTPSFEVLIVVGIVPEP